MHPVSRADTREPIDSHRRATPNSTFSGENRMIINSSPTIPVGGGDGSRKNPHIRVINSAPPSPPHVSPITDSLMEVGIMLLNSNSSLSQSSLLADRGMEYSLSGPWILISMEWYLSNENKERKTADWSQLCIDDHPAHHLGAGRGGHQPGGRVCYHSMLTDGRRGALAHLSVAISDPSTRLLLGNPWEESRVGQL